MAKSRVSLKDRKARDSKGVDALIRSTSARDEKPKGRPEGTIKTTVYLRPGQVEAVEEIQLQERKRTGKKPDKYALAQEAFDLLIRKYGLKG